MSPRHWPHPSGADHYRWKGGIRIHGGYRSILTPGHPRADSRGYVREHILVAEAALGKPLPPKAVVHHIDDDGLHNGPSNLVICEDNVYHTMLHARRRIVRAGGDPARNKVCQTCRRCLPREEFHRCKTWGDGLHPRCKECSRVQGRTDYLKRRAREKGGST